MSLSRSISFEIFEFSITELLLLFVGELLLDKKPEIKYMNSKLKN